MIRFGLGLAIFGVFVSLTALMLVFTGNPSAALRACPKWLIVTLAILLSLAVIAALAILLASSATGEALPLRFHVPVLALAVFSITLGLFSGLLVLQDRTL